MIADIGSIFTHKYATGEYKTNTYEELCYLPI